MLYLIGIGLKPEHLTLEAIETVKKCGSVFVETYTSQYAKGTLEELLKITGKSFKTLGRKEVEEQFDSALLSAKSNDIALLIFGNALTATTHLQILLDAKEKEIRTKIIPGISITNMIAESGLDEYKFGRTITICYHSEGYEPETFFDQILENQKIGLHTLCLLDIKKDEKPQRLMNCKEAIELLEKINKKRKKKNEFEYIALVGMSGDMQKIIYGKENIKQFKEIYEIYPQSLIVLGKANEKEKEAISLLHK